MPAEQRLGSAAGGADWKIVLVVVAAACSCKSGRAVSECEAAASAEKRNKCYQEKAIELNSRRLCLRLDKPRQQASCMSEFAKRGDVTACQEAATIFPVPECFSAVARASKQVEICDQIADFNQRINCVRGVASRAGDAKACEHIKEPRYHDECVAFAAEQVKDASICDGVQSPFRRDGCRVERGEYFRGAACARIEDTTRRDDCYLTAVRRFNGSLDLCDQVVARKAMCLMQFAAKRPEICERVGSGRNSFLRRRCYDAAFDGPRPSCAGISEQAQRLECEARASRRANDSAICATITTSEDADDCWDAVARTDGALCLRIKQPDFQRKCLRKNWPKAKDGRICSSLTPAYLSQSCAMRFGANSTNKLKP